MNYIPLGHRFQCPTSKWRRNGSTASMASLNVPSIIHIPIICRNRVAIFDKDIGHLKLPSRRRLAGWSGQAATVSSMTVPSVTADISQPRQAAVGWLLQSCFQFPFARLPIETYPFHKAFYLGLGSIDFCTRFIIRIPGHI